MENNVEIKRGDKVCVKKDTLIRRRGEIIISKRAYNVKLHDVYPGYTHDGVTRPARAVWAGAGGYWHEADLVDVEKL